jgi:KaiC/GvpD/RAD55 family RecA-like ATPase
MERISSGIAGLDDMVEGGFVKNTSVLVTGGCGSGKTTLAMQFLYEGAKKGERGIYITFEEEKERMKDNFSKYGWDIAGMEKKGMLEIIHIKPRDVMQVVKEDYGEIINNIKKLGAERVVLDSVSTIEMMISDEYERRESIVQIIEWLRKNNCTSMLVAESEQDPNRYSRQGVVEFIVDGVVVLYNFRRQSTRQRALEVLKMRGTNHMTKIVPFMISNGIELLPKQRLFGEM